MCGIAGIVGCDSREVIEVMRQAIDRLEHRGPDSQGFLALDGMNGHFGHARLSILDLSPAGAQPMVSTSGRWTLTYNGEIYGLDSLAMRLRQAGVHPEGRSDTALLVEALDRWGIDRTLEHIDGMFAFAAADRIEGAVHLVRDRFGEKPLCWHYQNHRLTFASEVGALKTLVHGGLQVNPAALASVLRWSFIPHPYTIYQDVWQLPPGHRLTFHLRSGETPQLNQWWDLRKNSVGTVPSDPSLTLGNAANQLGKLLVQSVAGKLDSDVPLGVFLSGGIDSSLVATAARKAIGGKALRTFTVAMPGAGLDEAPFARAVAAHLGTDHVVLPLTEREAIDVAPLIAGFWDEPFADPSMLPTFLICKAAREHVTVCLGGDGGDELFAGYNRHVIGAQLAHLTSRWPKAAKKAFGNGLLATPGWVVNAAGRMLRSDIPELDRKVQKAGLMLRGGGSAWSELVGIWPLEDLHTRPHQPSIPDWIANAPLLEQLMLTDTAVVLPDQMLVKVDRGAMASSLEVRSPFLSPEILSWAWSLPPHLKANGNTGKLVMRELARTWLPPAIHSRKKMGFDPPLAGWLRSELRDWAEDLLADPKSVSLGVLDHDSLAKTWDEHQRGTRNWDYRLWAVLMVESWLALND